MADRDDTLIISVLLVYATICSYALSLFHPVHSVLSDFSSALRSRGFVDKTLLIKLIFEMPEYCMITAPKGFGKTTNIHMLKNFLEIETNSDGLPLTNSDFLHYPVKDTPNYNLFVSNNLKITHYESIMDLYFGKYPVIHVDFRTARATSSIEDVVSLCRNVVHRSFLAHKYLMVSRELVYEEKVFYRTWCDVLKYDIFDAHQIAKGLSYLASFLSRHHHGRKCVVLVDEYDEAITSVESVIKEDLKNISTLIVETIYNVLISNSCVARTIMTGLHTLGGRLMELNNVYSFRFLDDHPFVPFFGFTYFEVKQVLDRIDPRDGSLKIHSVLTMYDGYVARSGIKIFNDNSILRFYQTKKPECYWCSFTDVILTKAYRFMLIRKRIIDLLQNKIIFVEIKDKFVLQDVLHLKHLIRYTRSKIEIPTDLFFTFMVYNGYLTYTNLGHCSKGAPMKIANGEVLQDLLSHVQGYYTDVCEFNKDAMKQCINFFDKLSPTANNKDPVFRERLAKFYKTLKILFQGFSNKYCLIKLTENELQNLISVLLFKSEYQFAIEFRYSYTDGKVEKMIRPDVILWKDSVGIILEFKYKSYSSDCSRSGLKQILQKEYHRVFHSEKFKDMKITNYIFIGLAIDTELNPYLSCLPNSYDMRKAVHFAPENVVVPMCIKNTECPKDLLNVRREALLPKLLSSTTIMINPKELKASTTPKKKIKKKRHKKRKNKKKRKYKF